MATQPNRFYAGSNSKDSSSLPLGQNGFPAANWPTNAIWGNNVLSNLNSRDASVLRGQDETFTNGNQASSTFSTGSETSDVWPQTSRPWTNADSNAALRRGSSSPSPARQRDGASELSNGMAATPSLLAAIGQTGAFSNNRPRTNGSAAADVNPGSFKYSASLRETIAGEGKDTNGISPFSSFPFDSEMNASRSRAVPDSSNAFTTASAAVSVAGSIASASAASGAASGPSNAANGNAGVPVFGSFGAMSASHHGHSHRPSLQASTFPSPAAPASSIPYHRNSQHEDPSTLAMAQMLRQKLTLEEQASEAAMNASAMDYAAGMAAAYPQVSGTASFQMNPVSEPWDARGQSGGFEMFPQIFDPTLATTINNRSSLASIDRGNTPIGSLRQISSPRSLGMPVSVGGPWSRPQSRDPRMSGLSDGVVNASNVYARQPLQALLHEQQLAAAGVSFGASTNFFSNNMPSYSPYNTYKAHMQMPPYGMQIASPMANSFVPTPHMQGPRDRDPVRSLRSPLLEEFRSSRTNRKYDLKDIYDHIVEFSGDQHGSRFIQSKLETANSDEKEHVFREISANTLVLMKDVFGNYVVQKFFEHGSQVQKKYLAEQMRGKMVELSTQTYACRVVQKALQYILVDQQVQLAKELEADVIRVVKDPNGNHVVQKVIELVPRESIGFVMAAFRGRVRELSLHNFGCRVVQRMLEYGSEDDKAEILAELHENTRELIVDQFGNYVTQHVIQFGDPSDRAKMINKVLDELVAMSRHKFASNVVEKCIEFGTPADRRRICEELEKIDSEGVPVLQHMIKDQYGNYVIQKLLKQLDEEERCTIVEALSVHLNNIKRPGSGGRSNTAIDRLASVVDDMSKKGGQGGQSAADKSYAGSTAPTSPQLPGNHEATPPLTNAPNTPESSNPPSVSAGPTGHGLVAKTDGMAVATKITLASDMKTRAVD